MKQLLNTLYITTPEAYIRLDNDTLRVNIEGQTKLRVPLHHLQGMVCFGNVLVSPAVIATMAESGKMLVFLSRNGRFKARLQGPVAGNVLLRQAHYQTAQDPEYASSIARNCIAGKLQNSRQILLRGAREATDTHAREQLEHTAKALARNIRKLTEEKNIDSLRGIEGDSAKRYFSALQYIIKPEHRSGFAMSGRNKRPPRDPINALLSFLYSMLMNDCRSAIEATGLDPQIGFLHRARPGRAALALDLMEEFRSILADRIALTLINRGQIKVSDFELLPGGAVRMKDDARKLIIASYQDRKQTEVKHPKLNSKQPIGLLPFLQAKLMASVIRKERTDYIPCIYK